RPVERRPWRTKPGIFKQWLRPELYGPLAGGARGTDGGEPMAGRAKVVLTDYVWESLDNPFVERGRFPVPGEKKELFAMLGESDFVSLHPPLLPATRGMMNDEAFARMKPTAFLVNCARGPIVDTPALVRALD